MVTEDLLELATLPVSRMFAAHGLVVEVPNRGHGKTNQLTRVSGLAVPQPPSGTRPDPP
jgi:hypothetical protein